MVIGLVPEPWGRWQGCVWVILNNSVFFTFFCKQVDIWKGCPSGPAVLMEVSATSEYIVIDFIATRASAWINSLPIILAWDFVKKNRWWWLVDCFGNGLEDISLDVVAVGLQRHSARTTASIPTWFLSAGCMHLCFPKQELTMCPLLLKPGQQQALFFPSWTNCVLWAG